MTDDDWTPVGEGLPEPEQDVLICDPNGRVGVGFYYDEDMGWNTFYPAGDVVVAWRPLPEPWKGE